MKIFTSLVYCKVSIADIARKLHLKPSPRRGLESVATGPCTGAGRSIAPDDVPAPVVRSYREKSSQQTKRHLLGGNENRLPVELQALQ